MNPFMSESMGRIDQMRKRMSTELEAAMDFKLPQQYCEAMVVGYMMMGSMGSSSPHVTSGVMFILNAFQKQLGVSDAVDNAAHAFTQRALIKELELMMLKKQDG